MEVCVYRTKDGLGHPDHPSVSPSVQTASSNRRFHSNRGRTVILLGEEAPPVVKGQLRVIYFCWEKRWSSYLQEAILPVYFFLTSRTVNIHPPVTDPVFLLYILALNWRVIHFASVHICHISISYVHFFPFFPKTNLITFCHRKSRKAVFLRHFVRIVCHQSPHSFLCFLILSGTVTQQEQSSLNLPFDDLNTPEVETMPRGHFM